jgi:hypothetical protein
MKKITRQHAIEMFRNLGAMALGHMDETTLSATLDNFDKFRKVQEDFQKLSEELAKRLYEGKDEKQKNEFFELVGKFERETELEKRIEIEQMMKQNAEFYELYVKQLKVLTQLLYKEIEIDITEIDKDDFIAGVVKGKKDARVHEIVAFFSPMFKEDEKKETDLSELDELLNC